MVETKTKAKATPPTNQQKRRGRPPGTGTGNLPKPEIATEENSSDDNLEEGVVSNKGAIKTSKPLSGRTKTTVATSAVVDPYAKALKYFDIKPTSDVYIQASYQTVTLTISPTVKSEFLKLLSDGANKAGFNYSQYGKIVYLNGITPNYDIKTVLTAIENAAALYNLKTEVSGQPPMTDAGTIQSQISSLVQSLLPASASS